MSQKAEDVVEKIFKSVAVSDDAGKLSDPLLELWKANRWTAEEIARATAEAYKPS